MIIMDSTDNSQMEAPSEVPKKRSMKPKIPPEVYRRVPPFSVQRLLKTMIEPKTSTTNQQQVSIKQDNMVDLEKLLINELNELLKKNDKLVNNKQLLSKLKDKGEKIISFRKKIVDTIESKEAVQKAEIMLEKLSLNSSESSAEAIIHQTDHRIKVIESASTTSRPRFNVTHKSNSTVKVTDLKSQDFREVKVKIEMPKAIKTLDFKDSLKTFEEANLKHQSAMADQILRFKANRIPESSDESDDEYDEEEIDYEDVGSPHVTVRLSSN